MGDEDELCITSRSKGSIKKVISDKLKEPGISSDKKEVLKDISKEINDMEKCQKKKRKKSEYQKFIGPCMIGKPKDKNQPEKMKECAGEWKEEKKKREA